MAVPLSRISHWRCISERWEASISRIRVWWRVGRCSGAYSRVLGELEAVAEAQDEGGPGLLPVVVVEVPLEANDGLVPSEPPVPIAVLSALDPLQLLQLEGPLALRHQLPVPVPLLLLLNGHGSEAEGTLSFSIDLL